MDLKRYFSTTQKRKHQSSPTPPKSLKSDENEEVQSDSRYVTDLEGSNSTYNSLAKKKYEQKCRDSWGSDPLLKDWITFKDQNAVECKYCHTIFGKPKYSNLKDHAITLKHRNAVEPFSAAKGSPKQSLLKYNKMTLINRVHESEARTSLFIAKHSSILSVDHLSKLTKLNFKDSPVCLNTKLNRTKCSGIIQNIWYPYFKEKIANDVGGNNPFSLLIDESTDISIIKYLGIVIKYHCKAESVIKTNLLKLHPLVACDADAIVTAILYVLNEYNLKIEDMCGLGTDNASVMVGARNGVFAKLKEMNPKIMLIPCVCHSLQLAVNAAAAAHLPNEIEFMISETYNWFSRSSNRQQNYQTIYKLLNDGHNPLKITQSCTTRWLSIESAVTRIKMQYLELQTYFALAKSSENCFKITSLEKLFTDELNYAYLCFFQPLLVEIQRVNKCFESERADFVKILSDLEYLMKLLLKYILKVNLGDDIDDIFIDLRTAGVQLKPHLGYECEEKLLELKNKGSITFEQEDLFRNNCKFFLIKLLQELQQRMPANLKILKQINLMSVDECLRETKNSLTPLLQQFSMNKEQSIKIKSQWDNLKLTSWRNTSSTESFWCEVYNHKDAANENPYSDLARFAISILVLPLSNAEVERIFSHLNIVKTKIRNRMNLHLTNSILIIRNQLRFSECCFNFPIPTEVTKKIGTNITYESSSTVYDEDANDDDETIEALSDINK